MFKASFPWATLAEEEAERVYLYNLQTTAKNEVAGNVWVPESFGMLASSNVMITF